MVVTPDQLANTLAGLLWCSKGRLGEATVHLADDPEYAALVAEQLEIGRQIDKSRRTAAWARCAAESGQAERGGTTDHNASIVG